MQVRGGFPAQPSCCSGPKVQLFLVTAVDFCSLCPPAALGEHRVSVSDTPPLPRFHLFASWAPACLIPQPCARLLITQTWGFLALVITHCGKPATFFSEGTAVAGTGTDTSSSNQQSRDRAVLISFDSLFASGGGTPSEKPTDPGRAGAPAGRHPRLICTPN